MSTSCLCIKEFHNMKLFVIFYKVVLITGVFWVLGETKINKTYSELKFYYILLLHQLSTHKRPLQVPISY